MPLKGDTPTNNIRKRLVYEKYGALHALVLICSWYHLLRPQVRNNTKTEVLYLVTQGTSHLSELTARSTGHQLLTSRFCSYC